MEFGDSGGSGGLQRQSQPGDQLCRAVHPSLAAGCSTEPTNSPGGYGYAAITNSLGGISTLGGALADGTPFLWSVPIARKRRRPALSIPLFGQGKFAGMDLLYQ